jgi:hypothetical protein
LHAENARDFRLEVLAPEMQRDWVRKFKLTNGGGPGNEY